MPALMTLHAPYTPFRNDRYRSLNATAENVDKLAAQAASFGVNTIFVPGGMSQFQTLRLSERKALMTYWIESGHRHGLYVIAHVGTSVLQDAVELAAFAQENGADAVASVPPYYESTSSVSVIVDFLKTIEDAAPRLPLFYYHIPSATGANIQVSNLLHQAEASNMSNLCGVKWVGDSLADWFQMVSHYNDTRALLFAPEPKLAHFSLGMGRGAVLAEDFYAQTYLRMRKAWIEGNRDEAASEQAWKYSSEAVFGKYANSPKRRVYTRFPLTRFDMGSGRLPQEPFDISQESQLFDDLEEVGFWKRVESDAGPFGVESE
eukprot:g2862.t1